MAGLEATIKQGNHNGQPALIVPRNDVAKTPEMIFVNIPRPVINLYLRSVEAHLGTVSPVGVGFLNQYSAGTAGAPLEFIGKFVSENQWLGQTHDNDEGPVIHANDKPGSRPGNPVTAGWDFQQKFESNPIEIDLGEFGYYKDGSFVFLDGKWKESGYIGGDAAMASVMGHETGHFMLREPFYTAKGHGEVYARFMSTPFGTLFDPNKISLMDDDVLAFEFSFSTPHLFQDGGNMWHLDELGVYGNIRRMLNGLSGEVTVPLSDKLKNLLLDENLKRNINAEDDDGEDPIAPKLMRDEAGKPSTLQFLGETLWRFDGGQFGSILGSQLGSRLTSNPIGQIFASGTLSTILGGIGEHLDPGANSTHILDRGIEGFGESLFANIKGAGIGAFSSYLTAELVKAVGVGGVAGEALNSLGGAAVNQIIYNIVHFGDAIRVGETVVGYREVFTDVGPDLAITAAASFIGNKLAAEIHTFESVGGQIGSAVGAAFAAWLVKPLLLSGNPVLMAAAVAVIVVANLWGGTIGSLFGGTPRSGADVAWSEAANEFVVANEYSRNGGDKRAAGSFASAAAFNLNTVLQASGATLLDPQAVQSGNYGMRKSEYVYRPASTRDKDAITARFKGNTAPADLITHGTYLGLTSMVGQMAGGDVYVKRAIAASLLAAGGNPDSNAAGAAGSFNTGTLLGDVAVGADFGTYVANAEAINMIIAADPQNSFAASWLVTIVRAAELGVNRRGETDWIGGYAAFLDESLDGKIDGKAIVASQLHMGYDPTTNLRYWTVYNGSGEILGFRNDTIESGAASQISGTDGNDAIVFAPGGSEAGSYSVIGSLDQINNTAGLWIDGQAASGAPFVIDVVAVVDAGGGNDEVHAGDMGNTVFGGAGVDTLYGGKLDDWMFGGDGNDALHAGSQAGGVGGNGNYLDGGEGDDILIGREGSDWLEGGEGTDVLDGGGGGDILAGGSGAGDALKGGHGDDQYVVRLGDGADTIDEIAGGAVVSFTSDEAALVNVAVGADLIRARATALAQNIIKKNWGGDSTHIAEAARLNAVEAARVAANPGTAAAPLARAAVDAGGEDAIVFDQGIGMGDVRMMRVDDGSVRSDTGRNLLIQVMAINPATNQPEPSGTQMLVKDWFVDTLKRVEWLKFADGNEIRIADIRTFVIGGPGDDILNGTDDNDFVYGDAGNDYIKLYRGDDIGSGATGDDAIFGDEDDDLLIGGLGKDKLFGGADDDVLTGDAGDDELNGDAGHDLLAGGLGDDLISGGAGDDTIKYSRGDGRDTILADVAAPETSSGYWEEVWDRSDNDWEATASGERWGPTIRREMSVDDTTARVLRWVPTSGTSPQATAGNDTIEFDLGINIQDIVFTMSGNDLVLAVSQENAGLGSAATAADTITITDWNGARPIGKMAFYQTGVIDVSTGTAGTKIIAGTDENDSITGADGAEWMTGGAGGDTLTGNGGDDILNGNGGDDELRGGDGNDVLYGGAGNDVLLGGAGGADVMVGGAGLDTVSYEGSDPSYQGSAEGVIANLSLASANGGDARGDSYFGIENLLGSNLIDRLTGDDVDNVIEGGKGNDVLRGDAGDDVYVWKKGDGADVITEGDFKFAAVLIGGGLADGYEVTNFQKAIDDEVNRIYWYSVQISGPTGVVYNGGFHSTAIYTLDDFAEFSLDADGWAAGYAGGRLDALTTLAAGTDVIEAAGDDMIELGDGIGLADLTFARNGDDLLISHVAGGSMKVSNQFVAGGQQQVEKLQFADGLTVNIANLVTNADGAAADDFIVGNGARNVLRGNGGHDVMFGGVGDDDLYGDDGDDILEGGAGADRLEGGGNSFQADNDKTNDGRGESVTWGDTARYAGSQGGVYVDLLNGVYYGGDADGDILNGIENVTGSQEGDDTLRGNDTGNRLNGLGGSRNVLYGLGGDDVLISGSGNDHLDGGEGVDDILGGAGLDDLFGGGGNDRLYGDAGDDRLYGNSGADALSGGDGRDTLEGGDGDDQLIGGAGELDTLRGGQGNDKLFGEGGADMLEGGEGADEYHFGAGAGSDTIADLSGANTILFGDGIDFDKLWLTKDGRNLKIAVMGTSDVLTVTDYYSDSTTYVAAAASIRSIQAGSHILFLDTVDAQTLIKKMSTSGTDSAELAALMSRNWHVGDKAAPTARTTPLPVEVAEDTSATITGDYQVVDHDSGGALTYSLSSDARPLHGTVDVNAATGAIVYTPIPDYNGTDSFSLVVTDADGQSALIPITVTVTPVEDRPTLQLLNPSASLISEQTSDWVAHFQIVGGGGATAELQFTINPGDLFTKNGSNVRFVGAPDFDALLKANPGFAVGDIDGDGLDEIVLSGEVRAVAGGNVSELQEFSVRVEDVNEAPTGLALGDKAASILERDNLGGTSPSRPEVVLGKVSVADGDIVILPDGSDVSRKTGQHDFTVFENGSIAQSTRFAVIGGELRLLDGKSLDYETDGTAITLRVVATDRSSAPLSIGQVFSFAIVDQVDVFEGDPSNNILTGQSGTDLIRGLAGDDTLGGGFGNDNLEGGLGNDTLDGGLGADMMAGGAGDDIYMVDTGDSVTELNGEGTDLVTTALGAYSLTGYVENLKYAGNASFTGTGNDLNNVITGGGGNDILIGGLGNDRLDGGAGNDRMFGGAGDDIYIVDSAGDTVEDEGRWDGTDFVMASSSSFTMMGYVENLTYTGNASFTGIGNDLNNVITGGAGNDALYGGGAYDTLYGGAGDDTLDGGLGEYDTLVGGTGNDIYVVDSGYDVVTELQSEGTDTVQTAIGSYSLAAKANVENLTYTGIASFTGTGNDLNNVIIGGAGNDTLNGGGGNDRLDGGLGNDRLDGGTGDDRMFGGAGDDIYIVDSAGDTAEAEGRWDGMDLVQTTLSSYSLMGYVENLTYTGNASFTGIGNDLNNVITGGAGNDALYGGGAYDTLYGGAGDDTLDGGLGEYDTLVGGTGNDIYVVDSGYDVVTELQSEGTDTVQTAIGSYSLAAKANVENLTYTGIASFTGTGNDLNNVIIGGAGNDALSGGGGNDRLDGRLGADTMAGGAGDDTYIVDVGDTVTELVAQGTDLVETTLAAYTLAANVENLTYAGTGNFIGTGNGLNNVMKGGIGADWFYLQAGGNDAVIGDAGNDVILYGASLTSADKVDGGAGTDQIALQGNYATTALTLGADMLNIESLGVLNGADTRFGDSGTNFYSYNIATLNINVAAGVLFTVDATSLRASETLTFNGAAESNGSFRMFGGDGNDTLTGGGGADTLFGRAGNDTLTGGAGNDTLDGGTGADAMTGGAGDDTYVVDAEDSITEAAGGGTDLVQTALDIYALGETFENLTYTGVGNFKGTGNASNNVIVGGAGSDLLYLQTGGVDTVDGGAGNDLFFFIGSLTAADIVTGGAGDDDTIIVQGNYSTGLSLTNNVAGIESVSLLAGTNTAFGESGTSRYSYNITISDTNLGTGQLGLAKINGSSLLAGENLAFNGAAETDIRLLIYGGMGADTLTGGAKDDVFFFATGGRFAANDKVIGGAGYDGLFLRGDYVIDFNAAGFAGALQGIENITLSSVVDTRYAKELGDGEFDYSIIWNDAHLGAGETITVNGSGGGGLQANEEMFFDGSRETNGILRLFGGAGNDTLVSGAGNDTLNGGAGNDTLFGGTGADTMTGGAGDDVFFVDSATDTVSEVAGEGTDLVKTTSTSYALGTNVEDLTYIGTGNIIGQGNALNNVITGAANNDFLMGGEGNDTLYGGLGADTLSGGLGNDTLTGGEGADTLYGDNGADIFRFLDANVSGADRIADFLVGTDKIDLSGLDANTAAAGTQTYAFIGTGAFSGSAGQLRYFQSGVDTKVQADRNGDGIADFEIVLTGSAALGAGSFIGINQGLPPIIFDLAGSGLEKAFTTRTIAYDLDGDGGMERVQWLSAGFGFLALDRNGDGAISSRLEISFTQDKAGAKTDLEGLSAFDSNADGLFSAADARFGEFRVWQDHNNDGVSAASELRSLAETGIVSINLQPTATGRTLDGTLGNVILNTTSFTRADGSQGTIGDTVLRASAESAESFEASVAKPIYARKSGKYRVGAGAGGLLVAARRADGVTDPRAGEIGAAAVLSFRDRQVGMLAPIVLDLDNDGLELKKRSKATARFDMDGNGVGDDTGWIGRDDGFLVADLDSDGLVGSASELSLLGLKPDARSSLEALATLDSNRDGKVDADDTRFAELKVWRDRNGNGISEAGEVASLADHGIVSIGLNAQATAAKVKVGQNIVFATSTFARADGTTGTAGGVGLAFTPSPVSHARRQPASGIADQLRALRSGLQDGRSLRWPVIDGLGGEGAGLANEAETPDNPKSGFVSPACDLPLPEAVSQLAEAPGSGSGQAPAGMADPHQDRLAFMVQQMASFGARPGEDEWKTRASNLPNYDYFAS